MGTGAGSEAFAVRARAMKGNRAGRRQAGMGLLGMLTIATMAGFFVMAGLKIAPGYVEYLQVKDVIIRVAEEYDTEEDTISDIRRSLAGYLNTNQIKAIDYRTVEIARKSGKVVINANYEDRIPLVWRIDAVVRYDDLVFNAGETYSE